MKRILVLMLLLGVMFTGVACAQGDGDGDIDIGTEIKDTVEVTDFATDKAELLREQDELQRRAMQYQQTLQNIRDRLVQIQALLQFIDEKTGGENETE